MKVNLSKNKLKIILVYSNCLKQFFLDIYVFNEYLIYLANIFILNIYYT